MIKQPKRGTRNVNDLFYESEKRRIRKLNEALGDIELTRAEEKTMIWLAGWEDCTVAHIISAFAKSRCKQ